MLLMSALLKNNLSFEGWVLENLATAIILFDESLRISYVNPAAEMLLASSSRHLVGQEANSVLVCSADHVDSEDHISNVIKSSKPLTEREIKLSFPGNREVTVDCTVIPLSELDGAQGVLLELQQVDRQLRISREEHLISGQQASRDVVRGLAHEIKNPLGGLRGAAQLLEGELEEAELKEYTQVIIEEADRLQTLVNNILGPNQKPAFTHLNIHSVLERVRALVSAETGEKLRIIIDYDPSIPEINGDMDQLIQATLNITRNAARAAGDNGEIRLRTRIQRQLTIGNLKHALAVKVDIIDNGPGIPEEIRETLFYPMVTQGTGGMGLGLSIAQSVVTLHKGLIEFDSKPGETVFTIYLPLEALK